MKVTETGFPGLKIIKPEIYKDFRGHFFESYNLEKMQNSGLEANFIQDNQSESSYGVIRGLHYQKNPYAQTKLIRVVHGIIFDVVLDLRQNSPTFGKWFGIEISDENNMQLFIPKGFAHGFSVLTAKAIVIYKCDRLYHPQSETGIIYNDPFLVIDWKIPNGKEIISEKDKALKLFKYAEHNFIY